LSSKKQEKQTKGEEGSPLKWKRRSLVYQKTRKKSMKEHKKVRRDKESSGQERKVTTMISRQKKH